MTSKADLLEQLNTEIADWDAFLAGIDEAHLDQPGAAGPWSIKDIIAHIAGWRRRAVARLQAAPGQDEPATPWPAHLTEDDDVNAWFYEENSGKPVSEVLAEDRQVLAQLRAAIEALPEADVVDPRRFPWLGGHRLTEAGLFGHWHEEHEADVRAWLRRLESEANA